MSALKALVIPHAIADDLHLKPSGQGVYHGSANAVQAARHLVPAAAELAARVQDGKHHRDRRKAGLVLYPDGDAPAVI